MANSTDFRADQVQTSKIIVTGSNPQKTLLIYGIDADGSPANQGNIDPTVFDTSSIGSDVFLFVSGTVGGRGGAVPSIVAFGGDLHISGNLTIDGTYPSGGGGGNDFFFSNTLDVIETSGSLKLSGSVAMTFLSASIGAEITGSLTNGAAGIVASGVDSHAEGSFSTASGNYSHAEGSLSTASGVASHAEGESTTASGDKSHAEGESTTASGEASHAEGFSSTASGDISHAEGLSTTASGDASHSEGYGTTSQGIFSHAEGYETIAFGTGSLAAGLGTIASGAIDGVFPPTTTQAAFGKYNLQGNSDSLFVIGDGFDNSNRHDVLRVNSGSVQITGSLEVLGGITGSLSGTVAGNPFMIAGSNITANYNSLGQWEITGSGGGGTNYFTEIALNSIETTGSVAMTFLSASTGASITGSLEVLGGITGSISGTVAGNPFIVAGTNVTVNYNSLGQWEVTSSGGGGGGGTQKQFVAKYEETTSTTPIIIGQFSWIPSDYASLTTLRVRAIMSTDGTANHTGSLQIYNLTSNAYVNLVDTPSVDSLFTITTSTPTLVTSSNLLSGGTNFDNITDSIYEVRISGSTANTTIIGGVELVYS